MTPVLSPCSDKLLATGFEPSYSVAEAMQDLQAAHTPGGDDHPRCHNVWMNTLLNQDRIKMMPLEERIIKTNLN